MRGNRSIQTPRRIFSLARRDQLPYLFLWDHLFVLPVTMAANGEKVSDAVNVPAEIFDTILVLDFG
jgi:hypothetical protein